MCCIMLHGQRICSITHELLSDFQFGYFNNENLQHTFHTLNMLQALHQKWQIVDFLSKT